MILFSFVLNKVIIGAIIVVIIIVAVGLFSVLEKSENLDSDDQSLDKESSTPKKITLELSDGINLNDGGP